MTAIATKPARVAIQGSCAGCGRSIPYGYIPVVTSWAVKVWSETTNNKLTVMIPATLYCRPCGDSLEGPGKHRVRRHVIETEVVVPEELSAKEIMKRIYAATSSEPHGSKRLAKMAGIEYTDLVLEILKLLKQAGKVISVEGRWARKGATI